MSIVVQTRDGGAGFIAQARNLSVESRNVRTNVPDNLISKLQYYLSCANCLLELDLPSILTNYQSDTFPEGGLKPLIELCLILEPEFMQENKLFILVDNMESNNEFIEIHDNRYGLAVSQNILIAGKQVRIHKLMLCTERWLRANFYEPMSEFRNRLNSPSNEPAEANCCLIL